ncbi:MAG: RES family NAD+ phosphorylase [Bryobacter sp.]|nr:RES family NAD+ phosphorylase [Bryobacter sp.]
MRFQQIRQKLWRAVEAQHRVSTLRLVDHNLAEHEALESIVEQSKPPLPEGAERLHYLLATPFRYRSRHASRFRAPQDPGVFYGAAEVRTACAELGYWRWRFLRASEGLPALEAAPHTLFQASGEGKTLDLRKAPWRSQRAQWTHPDDYTATQALGREVRAAGGEMIVYESVRDPAQGMCTAVLKPVVFHPRRPTSQQTWFLTVTPSAAIWTRERTEFCFRFA